MRQKQQPDQQPPFPGDFSLVADFLNTTDRITGVEAWTDPQALGRWLERQGFLREVPRLGEDDLERAFAVRSELRSLIAGGDRTPHPDRIAKLDQWAASTLCRPRFTDAGEVRFEAGGDDLAGVLGWIFALVGAAQAAKWWPRVKICSDSSCGRVYYDDSNGLRRKWCQPTCKHRVHAQLHRQRYPDKDRKASRRYYLRMDG